MTQDSAAGQVSQEGTDSGGFAVDGGSSQPTRVEESQPPAEQPAVDVVQALDACPLGECQELLEVPAIGHDGPLGQTPLNAQALEIRSRRVCSPSRESHAHTVILAGADAQSNVSRSAYQPVAPHNASLCLELAKPHEQLLHWQSRLDGQPFGASTDTNQFQQRILRRCLLHFNPGGC